MPPASEIHRGAIAERLAKETGPRCEATAPYWMSTPTQAERWRCAYKLGHAGPHFRGGFIW